MPSQYPIQLPAPKSPGVRSVPGVETLPDRQGNAKTCISGQSYVCGRACLGIGSNVTPNCNRDLKPQNIEKAKQILSVLSSRRNSLPNSNGDPNYQQSQTGRTTPVPSNTPAERTPATVPTKNIQTDRPSRQQQPARSVNSSGGGTRTNRL